MNPISTTSGSLTAAIASANTMAQSLGSTVSSNSGWFILLATAGLLVAILFWFVRSLSRLGIGAAPLSPGRGAARTPRSDLVNDPYFMGWVDRKEKELATLKAYQAINK